MIELEKEFKWGGDGFSAHPHRFVQIKRNRKFAIYQRFTEDGKPFTFEVITIGVIRKGTVIKQYNKIYTDDQEFYPGSKAFGKTAWEYKHIQVAEKKFDELTKNFEKDYGKL